MHQLANVAAALPHVREPCLDERPQFIALRAQPRIDRGVVFYRRRKAQQVVHISLLLQKCRGLKAFSLKACSRHLTGFIWTWNLLEIVAVVLNTFKEYRRFPAIPG